MFYVFHLLRIYRLIKMNNIVRDIFLNRTGEDILVIRKRKQEPLMSGSQAEVEVCILGVSLLNLADGGICSFVCYFTGF